MNENTVLSIKIKNSGILDDPLSSLPDLDDESLGFIQKAAEKKVTKSSSDDDNEPAYNRYKGSGYIDPIHQKVNPMDHATYLRFKQFTNADQQFDNVHYQKSDTNNPASSRELLRQKELSNGVLLVEKKRTANFETGPFLDFYYANHSGSA